MPARLVSTKSAFTSSRTISIRSPWNRTRRLLTSDVTHRPPSSSNANPSGKNPSLHGEDRFGRAKCRPRSNRKATHPSSKRLDDVQPCAGRIRPDFVGVVQAVGDDARAVCVQQDDEPVADIGTPGLLARDEPSADRNPDTILLVDRDEVRRREAEPRRLRAPPESEAPSDPAARSRRRRPGSRSRTSRRRRGRCRSGAGQSTTPRATSGSGHRRAPRSRRPAIPARTHRRPVWRRRTRAGSGPRRGARVR